MLYYTVVSKLHAAASALVVGVCMWHALSSGTRLLVAGGVGGALQCGQMASDCADASRWVPVVTTTITAANAIRMATAACGLQPPATGEVPRVMCGKVFQAVHSYASKPDAAPEPEVEELSIAETMMRAAKDVDGAGTIKLPSPSLKFGAQSKARRGARTEHQCSARAGC